MARSGSLHDTLAAHIGRGEVPGLVAIVSRHGRVAVEVMGTKTAGSADPVQRDTLFRITSMTKPVTAVAAMILVEDGKLRLDEPVDRLLPELADRRVLRRIDGPLDDSVPAARAITVRDLLTMRLGFGIVWGPPDGTPIQRAASVLQLGAFGPPRPQEPPPPDEWIRRFATLPLMHQPGERWMYNTGIEVLSVLVPRAAGMPLEDFMRRRIFEPLGMKDTSFAVPETEIDRLPTSYMTRSFEGGTGFDVYDPVRGQWSKPPAFPSGSAGLVSTADDFLAFGLMLLGGGERAGARILSKASVEQMTSDQLTAGQKALSEMPPPGFWSNHGWGLGMAVVTGPDELTGASAGYGWSGGLGTSWSNDPTRGTCAILMTQRGAFPALDPVYRDFWRAVSRGA
jgi:CubicO group peptidase (beta-lactamase class C family)